jgi:hypothetical protein
MRVLNDIVIGFRATWVSCESTPLTQMIELISATRHDLMDIALVTGVEENEIAR